MIEMISLVTPLLLHMGLTFLTGNFIAIAANMAGQPYDGTLSTVVGNLLVIPIAAWWYQRDKRASQNLSDKSASQNLRNMGKPGSAATTVRQPQKMLQQGFQSCTGQVLFGVFCFLAGGVLNIFWSSILNAIQIQNYFSNRVQAELLSSNMAVQALGLGIIVPIAEELIFRGLTYKRMKRVFPVKVAILLSALLFAVYHGNLIQIIFAFPLAVVMALVFEHGKLFVYPVLFHIGANLTTIFLNFYL